MESFDSVAEVQSFEPRQQLRTEELASWMHSHFQRSTKPKSSKNDRLNGNFAAASAHVN
jgi:hypothetical protein